MQESENPPHNGIRSPRYDRGVWVIAAVAAASIVHSARAQELPVQGVTGAHDPSTITQVGSSYYYYVTGQGIVARSSTDLVNWNNGTTVFATQPAWTTTAVPGFTGNFWAPDVMYRNNQYYMYYAVSTFGSQVSAIGLAISPTLNPAASNYGWADQGAVIQSSRGLAYNTIDPSLLQNSDGTVWMSFGSYWQGIYLAQLDPASGKVLNGTSTTHLAVNNANNADSYFNGIEASYLLHQNGFFYLFENWGACCSGITSTYNIRVGRSTSVTGPYVDANGVPLTSGGGTLFMGNDGNQIGPGQFSFFMNGTQQEFGYHYYDANNNGAPTEGIRDLYWTANDWPSIAPVNPNWTGTGASANWSTGTNWSDTVPNAAGNIANFVTTTSGTKTVTLDGSAKTVAAVNFNSTTTNFVLGSTAGNALILDSGNSNPVQINSQFGNHSILAPITANESLQVQIAQTSETLTLGAVTGSTLTKYGPGILNLTGVNSYSSSVLVHNGTISVTGAVTANSFNSIGYVAGDVGILTISGSGSFTSGADLNIGDTGATGTGGTPATGTLNLIGSAQITVNSTGGFYVGSGFASNANATGAVYQTGGTLTDNDNADGGLTIGGRLSSRAVGVYNFSAGNIYANTNVWDGGYGTGTINQTGGVFNAAAYVSIGRQSHSTGVWNLSGGLLAQTTVADSLIVGESGTGTLTISGTAVVIAASNLKLGANSGSSGTVNLSGGSLVVSLISRGTGTGVFYFNDGTLKAAGPNSSFLQGLSSANILTGGAIIDTSVYAITIAQPLLTGITNDGGLTKKGFGTLSLTAAETYTGATNITSGVLTLAGTGSLQSTSLIVNAGTTLNINGPIPVLTTLNSSGTTNFGFNTGTGLLVRKLSSLVIGAQGIVDILPPSSHANHTLLTVGSLSFLGTSTGLLDLTGNDLDVQSGSVPSISGQLARGYAAGAWNSGAGILSSTAAADTTHLTAIGLASGLSTFDGQSVSPTDVLAKYAYYGDANLDGKVDGTDYSRIDNGLLNQLTSWYNGDFNYDGVVNGSDYALIDNAYNSQGASLTTSVAGPAANITDQLPGSPVSVPEPAIDYLLVLGAAGLQRRGKRPR